MFPFTDRLAPCVYSAHMGSASCLETLLLSVSGAVGRQNQRHGPVLRNRAPQEVLPVSENPLSVKVKAAAEPRSQECHSFVLAEEGAVVNSHYIIMKAINLYLGKLGETIWRL